MSLFPRNLVSDTYTALSAVWYAKGAFLHAIATSATVLRLRIGLALMLVGLAHSVLGQPDNDAFTHATPLQGEHTEFDIAFLGATHEPQEPDILQGATVWYTWTAPREGVLRLYPNSIVYLFQGTELASLACQQPVAGGIATFYKVGANETYIIAVVSPGINVNGTYTPLHFSLDFATPPANDLFTNQIPLAGETVEGRGPTVGATQQPGEPFAALWWTWTAPASGTVTLELIEATGYTVAAFTGTSLVTLNLIGQVPHPQYPVSFPVEAGQQYHIAADGFGNEPVAFRLGLERLLIAQGVSQNQVFHQGDSLKVTFSGVMLEDTITNLTIFDNMLGTILNTNTLAPLWMPFLPPGWHTIAVQAKAASGRRYTLPSMQFCVLSANDYFDERPNLSGDDVIVEANLRGAPPYPAVNVLWWKWTAPYSGIIQADQLSGEALSWALYKGTSVNTLTQVTDWAVQAGETYSLQASALHAVGTYRFRILRTPPTNDAFSNARRLDESELWEPIRIDTATPDPGEPGIEVAPTFPSIWFTFVPDTNGVVTFAGGTSLFYLTSYLWPGSVFSGTSLDALVAVPPLDGGFQFPVKAGQPYALRLQKAFPGDNSFPYVYFLFTASPANDAFTEATVLTGERAAFTVGLHGATGVSDEPATYVGSTPQRSIWYQWTPPHDGFASVRFPGSSGSIAIGVEVFTNGPTLGPSPAMLLENEGIFFQASAATTYYLRFSDYSGLWTNQYAAELSLTGLTLSSPTPGAAFMSPVGPQLAISGPQSFRSVSYREKTGWGSGGLGRGAIWRETTNLLAAPFSYTEADLSVGLHTYYAVVTNLEGQESYLPPVVFEIRPPNDSFATRQVLSGRKVSIQGTTISASVEPGEPSIGNPAADLTVWYTWVAPASAPTVIKAFGENYVRLFEGTALTNLTPVSPTTPVTPQLSFTPVAGTTYQIAVASVSTNLPSGHWTTFGMSIDMDLMSMVTPVSGSVYGPESTVSVSISTPERPDQVVSTLYTAIVDRERLLTLLEAPELVTGFSWTNPSPGTWTISAKLTFLSGEVVSRSASIRVSPTNVSFTNATVLV